MGRICHGVEAIFLLLLVACYSLYFSSFSASASSSIGGNTTHAKEAESQMVAAIDSTSSSTQCNITGACIPCTKEQLEQDPSCEPTGFIQAISCVEFFPRGKGAAARSGGGQTGGAKAARQSSAEDSDASGLSESSDSSLEKEAQGIPESTAGEEEDGKEEKEKEKVKETEEQKEKEEKEEKKRVPSPDDNGLQRRRLLVFSAPEAGDMEGPTRTASSRWLFRHLLWESRRLGARGRSGRRSRRAQEEAMAKIRRFITFESCKPEVETLSVLAFESIMLAILAVCGPIVYHRKRRAALNSGGSSRPPGSGRF